MDSGNEVKQLARVEIYALVDPITNEVRYIGKANDSKKRLLSHLRDSKRRSYPVYMWIRKLGRNGLIPKIKILLISDSDNWKSHETILIREYRNNGARLLNVADGGDQPYCPREVRVSNGIKNLIEAKKDPNYAAKRHISMYFNKKLKEEGVESCVEFIERLDKKAKNNVQRDLLNKLKAKIS